MTRSLVALAAALGLASLASAQTSHPSQIWPAGLRTNGPSLLLDVDEDGRLDLVQASGLGHAFFVSSGDGFGGFAPPETIPTVYAPASNPIDIDFDEDGDQDIVASTGSVLLRLRADGAGGFTTLAPLPLPPGTGGRRLFTVDGDQDGHADIISVNSSLIAVFNGDGLGGFTLTTTFPKPQTGTVVAAAAGDFDADGDLDIASRASTSQVDVFSGDGAGGFLPSIAMTTPVNPTNIVAGDVDADGDDDLLISSWVLSANGPPAGVAWIESLGAFSFAAPSVLPAFDRAFSVALADLDMNGVTDVVATSLGETTVQVDAFAATPGAVIRRPTSLWHETVQIARLDGDLLDDLVFTDSSTQSYVTVLLGDVDTLVQGTEPNETQKSTFLLALDDLDGDGDRDAIAVENEVGTIRWYGNDGTGGFSLVASHAIGHPVGAAAAVDLDGDSVLEVVAGTAWSSAPRVTILSGQAGGYSLLTTVSLPDHPRSIEFGRFNADQDVDFVVGDFTNPNDGFYVVASSPTGYSATLVPQPGIDASGIFSLPTNALAAMDVNQDGFDDVVAMVGLADLRLFLADGQGGFTLAGTLPGQQGANGIVAADVDGDGLRDLVLAPGPLVFRNTGAGLLGTPPPAEDTALLNGRLYAFDVDQDGLDDVVSTSRFSNRPSFAWSRSIGDLTFEAPRLHAAFGDPSACLTGDINQDGRNDFLVSEGRAFVVVPPFGSVYHAPFGCDGAVGRHGTSCAVASGSVPSLGVNGCAEPGETLTFQITGAVGATMGLVLLGQSPASTPISNGCTLSVGPLLPAMVAVPIGPSGVGSFTVQVQPSAAGVSASAQALFAPIGASDAVEVRVGL